MSINAFLILDQKCWFITCLFTKRLSDKRETHANRGDHKKRMALLMLSWPIDYIWTVLVQEMSCWLPTAHHDPNQCCPIFKWIPRNKSRWNKKDNSNLCILCHTSGNAIYQEKGILLSSCRIGWLITGNTSLLACRPFFPADWIWAQLPISWQSGLILLDHHKQLQALLFEGLFCFNRFVFAL